MRITTTDHHLTFTGNPIKRSKTDFIVIHHTASQKEMKIEDIHKMHQNKRWIGIGYHRVINKDGSTHQGRPDWARGAQCKDFNNVSFGICLQGHFGVESPTQAQIDALVLNLADLCEEYKLTPSQTTIVGHRDKNPTECPGDNCYSLLPKIREMVKKQ